MWEPSDRVSLRFNAQQDEIADTQARVNTYIDPQIAWNSGYQVGLSQAYDIASGGKWNCHYVCSGYPGRSRRRVGGPLRTSPYRRARTCEQQTLDLKVALGDSVELRVSRRPHLTTTLASTTTGTPRSSTSTSTTS